MEKVKKLERQPVIITLDFVKSLEKSYEIEEIKKDGAKKTTLSIEDLSNFLVERYEKIKSFFSYRLDVVNLISINKINEKTKKFSLIVMVREIDRENKIAFVEDLTGEISVRVLNDLIDFLVQDEVVGLFCEKKDEEIQVTNVFWPDIPLKRTIGKLEEDILCLFVSEVAFEENYEEILKEISKLNFKFLFIFLFLNKILEEKLKVFKEKIPPNSKLVLISNAKQNFDDILCFSSPAFLVLDKKIVFLLVDGKIFSNYKNLGKDCVEIMLNLLKKRHLNPIFKIENLSLEDRYLVDPIPDIFVSANFGNSSLINYKGTTIISCGSSEKLFWIVNLKSRENLKISLT
ncbi:MAG: hypothetical protein QW472_02170 [Candidatus Aenigmatarchaeota archaeon]